MLQTEQRKISSLFYDVTQRRVVVTDVAGQLFGEHLEESSGPRRTPATWVRGYVGNSVSGEGFSENVTTTSRVTGAFRARIGERQEGSRFA